jgi:hypothetical protein
MRGRSQNGASEAHPTSFTQNGILVESSNYVQMILVKDEFWEVKKMEE